MEDCEFVGFAEFGEVARICGFAGLMKLRGFASLRDSPEIWCFVV